MKNTIINTIITMIVSTPILFYVLTKWRYEDGFVALIIAVLMSFTGSVLGHITTTIIPKMFNNITHDDGMR